MDYKITGYEPAQLFHFFEEVSAIPRGSGNEKGISDFLVAFAKERGLDVYQDEVYNVIIRKPASAGAENAPTVMLQGHIDMVCDKLGSVEHDFTTDGIDLVVKDGVLTANGTTLGADNGIAVALMLTVLNDDSIAHPALECVFTTDEETGLVGAETLDKSQISARSTSIPRKRALPPSAAPAASSLPTPAPSCASTRPVAPSRSTSPACWAATPAAISTWSAATATSSWPASSTA